MLESGTLTRYIRDDGITGVTANPTIFEKAIADGHDYDRSIRELARKGAAPAEIYETLAIADVGNAADILRPVYDRSGGTDGFASIEVSPDLANDTEATLVEARRFWSELHRPNVLIKVPATPAGIPAIERLIGEGINVNITLIFAVEVYDQVMDAYLRGLERRSREGEQLDNVASVASFFVSRVDTLVDKLLEEKAGAAGGQEPARLTGKAAVANAKVAYEHFERVWSSPRSTGLAEKGAQVQRPLWASTSTKNPRYPDTLYVEPLIGRDTVNTMTLDTIEAIRDHGVVACGSILQGRAEAHQVLDELEKTGISIKAVTDQLTVEGVQKFSKSLHRLLDTIDERRGVLAGA
jgi:transaldolase